MDKFDQLIQNAQQTYEPNNNFVEETMKQISNRQRPKRWHINPWMQALAGGLAVIAIIFVLLPSGNHTVVPVSNTKNTTSPGGSGTMTQHPSAGVTSRTPAIGTDNASLSSDLSGVNDSMSQENSDQNSASATLNDNQQQIAVPTN